MPEPVACEDDDRLPSWGYGVTNIVARPTPGVSDLTPAEFAAGRARLQRKVRRHRPQVVALVGVTVFRAMFPHLKTRPLPVGLQPERIGGAAVFVLPNPSGRNANFSHADMLRLFRGLRRYLTRTGTPIASARPSPGG